MASRRIGQGAVFEDKGRPGYWIVRRVIHDTQGKPMKDALGKPAPRLQVRVQGKTETAAARLAKPMLDAKEAEWRDLNAGGGEALTFAQWAEQWLADRSRELKPATTRGYRSLLDRHVLPAIGHLRLQDITPTTVRALVEKVAKSPSAQGQAKRDNPVMGAPLGPSGYNAALRMVKTCLAHAVSMGHIKSNPAEAIKSRKVKRATSDESAPLTPDEAYAIFPALDDQPLGSLFQALILTGCRVSELLGLERSRVTDVIRLDWQLFAPTWEHGCGGACREGRRGADCPHRTWTPPEDQEVRDLPRLDGGDFPDVAGVLIRPKTTSSIRTRPNTGLLATVLADAMQGPSAYGLVWEQSSMRKGREWVRPLSAGRVLEVWGQVSEALNVRPGIPVHGFRHTYTDIASDAGIDLGRVADMIGHASPKMTRYYMSPEQSRRDATVHAQYEAQFTQREQ